MGWILLSEMVFKWHYTTKLVPYFLTIDVILQNLEGLMFTTGTQLKLMLSIKRTVCEKKLKIHESFC